MITTQFSHVAINCRDPLTMEQFYARHFGFERARVVEAGAMKIVFLKSGDMYLELFQASGDAPVAPPENDGYPWAGCRHLAFKVDDVDGKLKEFDADAHVNLGPVSFNDFIPGWRSAWIADPEGNVIEISQGFVDQDHPPALAC